MKKFFLYWFSLLRPLAQGLVRLVTGINTLALYPMDKLRLLWARLSHFQQNIVIGTAIAVFISIFHHYSFISEMEDRAMDWMMQINQSLERVSGINAEKTGIRGYVLLDIDQQTYARWGEPYHVPRRELVRLIRFAASAARVVVVDIELSRAGTDPAADAELAAFLENYDRENRADLVLIRTLSADGRSLKPMFFQEDRIGKKIHFGLPLFQKDPDYRIRRWFLSREVCASGHPTRILSVQLLTDLLVHRVDEQHIAEMSRIDAGYDCGDHPGTVSGSGHEGHGSPPGHGDVVHYAGRTIDLAAHGMAERLIYTIPWQGIGNDNRVSARTVLAAANPSAELLRDKIVVIGASFAESRDIHATPLGEMPGALVLVNAIKSLNQWGQIVTPPGWIKWLIEALLIVFMAWVYARTNSFLGTIVVGATILVVLVPVSFWLFKAGMWVDFAIPVFGMQLHQLVAEYEEKIRLKTSRHERQAT
jgi:CHASE2 domain-containing sensor protein